MRTILLASSDPYLRTEPGTWIHRLTEWFPWVRLTEDLAQADLIIHSYYDERWRAYPDAIAVEYGGENVLPDFNQCDYAISPYRVSYGDRHLRRPLFCFRPAFRALFAPDGTLLPFDAHTEAAAKTRFCTIVVSNANRDGACVRLFDLLSAHKPVASGGKWRNTFGGRRVDDKLAFLRTGYAFDTPRRDILLTVGQMAYPPNHEGVDRFLAEIWPSVRAAFPRLTYRIVGRGAPEACQRRWRATPGVEVAGFVEDLDAEYASALACVAPVDAGSGTCIKTIEALLHGRCCLAAPFAVRGWGRETLDGSLGLHVYHSAQDFVDCLRDAVLDEATRTRQEAAGRAYAEARFGFEGFARQVRVGLGEHPRAGNRGIGKGFRAWTGWAKGRRGTHGASRRRPTSRSSWGVPTCARPSTSPIG